MSPLDFSLILVNIIVILGAIYRVFSKEKEIDKKIEAVQKNLDRINNLEEIKNLKIEHKLEAHIKDYRKDREIFNFQLADLKTTLDRRSDRLLNYVKDIEEYLKKTGNFRIRQHNTDPGEND